MSNVAPLAIYPFNCDPHEIVMYDGCGDMTARNAVKAVLRMPIAERLQATIFRDPSKHPALLTVPEIRELGDNNAFMSA